MGIARSSIGAALLVVGACGDDPFAVVIAFDPAGLAEAADTIELAVVPGCDGVVMHEPAQRAERMVRLSRDEQPALGRVAPEKRGVHARAIAEGCFVVAASCEDVHFADVAARGRLDVVLAIPTTCPGADCDRCGGVVDPPPVMPPPPPAGPPPPPVRPLPPPVGPPPPQVDAGTPPCGDGAPNPRNECEVCEGGVFVPNFFVPCGAALPGVCVGGLAGGECCTRGCATPFGCGTGVELQTCFDPMFGCVDCEAEGAIGCDASGCVFPM